MGRESLRIVGRQGTLRMVLPIMGEMSDRTERVFLRKVFGNDPFEQFRVGRRKASYLRSILHTAHQRHVTPPSCRGSHLWGCSLTRKVKVEII
jgi:hypothetical protein